MSISIHHLCTKISQILRILGKYWDFASGYVSKAITGEGFEAMRSMDVIRTHLNDVLKEKGELEKRKVETEKSIEKLNSRLLRAKDRLEEAEEFEGKTKGMLSILSLTLENLVREKEVAKEEGTELREEIENIRIGIWEIEAETRKNEETLQGVIRELEVVKTGEVNALEKLRVLAKDVARARDLKKKSMITILKFEYDYLVGCAAEARELADKKVAAAKAWEEALKAGEKEAVIKTAQAKNEIGELKLKEQLHNRRSMKDRDYSSTVETKKTNKLL